MNVKTHGLKLTKELKADESIKVSLLGKDKDKSDIIRLSVPLVIRRRHGRKIVLAPGKSEDAPVTGKNGPSKLS